MVIGHSEKSLCLMYFRFGAVVTYFRFEQFLLLEESTTQK